MTSSASVAATMKQINAALGRTHPGYSCKTVSWEDASRGTVGGGLSAVGPNITDVRLHAKDGTQLFTVRSDNWNEKIGKVNADEVCVIAEDNGELIPITLSTWLKNAGKYGAYAGLNPDANLYDPVLDKEVSIRFQTTFLPVPDAKFGNVEFAVENYNYQTRDASNPRNVLLLCTTQGCALQQDGPGAVKLFHHSFDEEENKIHRHWFECERTRHQVGGAQMETDEEKAEALIRGKATASVIGTRAMGTRFNVLMSIQIPTKQASPMWRGTEQYIEEQFQQIQSLSMLGSSISESLNYQCELLEECDSMQFETKQASGFSMFQNMSASISSISLPAASTSWFSRSSSVFGPKVGRASAARVSRGSEFDVWPGLTKKDPIRDPTQHITITVVIYNVVAGGIPSVEDVQASVNDLNQLYRSCDWSGKLADEGADFMKTELTVNAVNQIATKVATQPYKPPIKGVVNGNVFPTN